MHTSSTALKLDVKKSVNSMQKSLEEAVFMKVYKKELPQE